MLSLIIDGIIVAIIVFCIITSAKRGFVRTLIEVVGGLFVIYLAVTLSNPAAETIYQKAIEPSVIKSAEKSIEKSTDDAASKIWKSFPKFVTNNSNFFGITEDTVDKEIKENIKGKSEIAAKAVNAAAKPMIVKILSMLLSVVMIVLLLIAVRFSAKIINSLFNFSIIGKINRSLGGILGIPKGIVFSFVFCIAVMFLLSVNKNGFLIFTNNNINNTVIFKYLYGVLPFKF